MVFSYDYYCCHSALGFKIGISSYKTPSECTFILILHLYQRTSQFGGPNCVMGLYSFGLPYLSNHWICLSVLYVLPICENQNSRSREFVILPRWKLISAFCLSFSLSFFHLLWPEYFLPFVLLEGYSPGQLHYRFSETEKQ